MSGNGFGYVADIVQHVGGRALQIVAPLVVRTRVAVGTEGGIASLTDGRRGLGHDALCMLHHIHLPLEITHSRFQFAAIAVLRAAGVRVHVHVLGASQRTLLAGRGSGTAAGVVAAAALQIVQRLLGKVIANGTGCLVAATPNAAIAAALRCAARAAANAAAVVAVAGAGVAGVGGGCGSAAGSAAAATTAAATALGAAIDAVVQRAMHIQLQITRTAAHI